MAAFTYVYRTSEGKRLTAEIEAVSRDEAFAALRRRGIRPVKMMAQDGAKENGEPPRVRGRRRWRAVAVAAVAVAAALGALLVRERVRTEVSPSVFELVRSPARYRPATYGRFRKLVADAEIIKEVFDRDWKALELARLEDFAALEGMRDVSSLRERAGRAAKLLESTREQFRELFALLQALFPADSANEIRDAQRLYVELIGYLDGREAQLRGRVAVLEALDADRPGWACENGRLVFSDRRLESRVTFLQRSERSKDDAAKRWTLDFGSVGGP